jgi:4-hydroxythreonine-4-phosphate dehydrogenase
MSKPAVAVTMGDPAGISPEIVARAFADPEVRKACCPVAIGDPRILFRAMGS